MAERKGYVGQSVRRVEDPRFLKGRGQYLDDVRVARALAVAFVRSTHAHAKILRVDVAPAMRLPGVVAAISESDIAGLVKPLRVELRAPGFRATSFPALATGKVRFVGEAVAAVVAADGYLAEDATGAVKITYEQLGAVVDAELALLPEAPKVHDELPDNVFFMNSTSFGDVDEAFRAADLVVEETFTNGRCTGVPIETRGSLASWDADRQLLTFWSSTQIPHTLRTFLSECLMLPENRLRVIAPDVGGGFGVKLHVFPEDLVVCVLAMKLGQPVKWIETRRENLMASIHSREHRYRAAAAFRRDGTLLGLRARIVCDMGAYSTYPSGAVIEPAMAAQTLPGPYRLRHYAFETAGVATNKCPVGANRGVSRPVTTFVRERLLDMAAGALRLDPAEIRERNLLRREEFPYTTANGLTYDSGAYHECLDRALSIASYAELRREQQIGASSGRRLGIGIAAFVEDTARGSQFYIARGSTSAPRADSARIRVDPSGGVTADVGASPHGQGLETSLAQLVADELGVELESVRIQHGDTALGVYGAGTFGSRSAVITAGALTLAARALRDKMVWIAAPLLGVSPTELDVDRGFVIARANPTHRIAISEVARRAYRIPETLPEGVEPGLEATRYYDPPAPAFASGVHVVALEVDEETGAVTFRKYVAVEDCGTILNPMIVEGQVMGGVAQGVGGALYEELHYDEHGQLLTGSLMDYAVPTAAQIPAMTVCHVETPSPYTIGGYKGAGEGGTIGAPAAIANAISDALGTSVRHLPITSEQIYGLARCAKDAGLI